jgi:hypothetical protein
VSIGLSRFRNRNSDIEHLSASGMKWMCGERQRGRTLGDHRRAALHLHHIPGPLRVLRPSCLSHPAILA